MSSTSPSAAGLKISEKEASSRRSSLVVRATSAASLEGILEIATATFQVPVAVICLAGEGQYWSWSSEDPSLKLDAAVLELCQRSLETDRTLTYPNLGDTRWSAIASSQGLHFFAGTPIRLRDGNPAAALCLLDAQPRRFSEKHSRLLEQLATLAGDQIELQNLEGRLQTETQAREEAANAFLASENRFRSLVENASDIITVLAADGTIVFESPSVKTVLGYAPEEMAGQSVFKFLHPDEASEVSAAFGHLISSGQQSGLITFRFLHRDGSWRTLEAIGSNRLADPSVRGVVINSRDVTERAAAETQLHNSNQRFQSAFDESAIGIALVSPEGRWLSVNRALTQFLGYTREELLAVNFQSLTHPDDLNRDLELVSQVLRGELKAYTMEKRYFHREGHLVWALLTVSLVRDPAGNPLHFISQLQDISGRKADELSLLEARDEAERQSQIAEQARAEAEAANLAKSEFLSRISHELRTPLNAILGFGQLLELSNISPTDKQSVSHILKGGRHLLSLINEVLDIARIESGALALSPEPVSLAQVCVETLDLVRPLAAQSNVTLFENGIRDISTHVLADRQRLKQVLLNLLSNSIKYNRNGGSVHLRVEPFASEGGTPEIRLIVEDTGPGIPEEKLDRLFTPFDRLGAETTDIEGTGIGLALSRRLATAMKGQLGVHSQLGVGSSFWIQLPQSGNPMDKVHLFHEKQNAKPDNLVSTRWVVLCIEDNLPNLQLLNQVFSNRPAIRLLSASQGALGLELAQQHNPDLILLDLHVPEMCGEEVLERLRRDPRTATTPVIVISADATPGQVQRLMENGATAYLTKPFDVNHLLQTVDGLLDVRATVQQSQVG